MFRLWERVTGLQGSVFATLLCNILEHYDFIVYGIMSGIISKVFFLQDSFFPGSRDAYIASFISFLVFATAFIARPMGAWVFGYIGDKKGRRVALNASTLLLVGSTFCMAGLPTPSVLGVYSVVLLTLFRVLQGFAYGAEVGGVVLMMESVGERGLRIVWASRMVLCALSMVVGMLTVKVSETLLTVEQMYSWGWRIPFLGAVLISIPLPYLRRRIRESIEFMEYKISGGSEEIKNKETGVALWNAIKQNMGIAFLVTAMAALASGFFYIPVVYLDIGHRSTFLEYEISMMILALSASTGLLVSDFRKRRVFFMATLCVVTTFIYPVLYFIEEGYMLARFAMSLLSGLYLGWYGSFIALLFPIGIRQRCFSLSYNGGYMIGALAPAMCLWFYHNVGSDTMPALYFIVLSSVVVTIFMFFVRVKEGGYKLEFNRGMVSQSVHGGR